MISQKREEDLRKTNNLFKKIISVLKPPPKLTIDTWADSYRILSSKTSAEPGRWSTDRVPFQREVMRAISDKQTEKVVMMYGAQLSKTEILLNTFGYYTDYDPAPIMYLMPTQKLAEDFSKLVQGQSVNEDRLEDAALLSGVSKFPARIKCATLAWKALEKAVEQKNKKGI